jgi:hypothetical protein
MHVLQANCLEYVGRYRQDYRHTNASPRLWHRHQHPMQAMSTAVQIADKCQVIIEVDVQLGVCYNVFNSSFGINHKEILS